MVKSTKLHAKKFYVQQSFLCKFLVLVIAIVAMSSLAWFIYTGISKGFADVDNEAATEKVAGADTQATEEAAEAETTEENNATEKGNLNSEVSSNSNEVTSEALTENSNTPSNVIANGDGWDLDEDGTLTISGTVSGMPWSSVKQQMKRVVTVPGASATSCDHMFYGASNLVEVNLDYLDTSNCEIFNSMFASANNTDFQYLDLSKLNLAKATDLSYMFSSCENLKSINVSNWKTSKVTSMDNMFNRCLSLISLDLSSWDMAQGATTNMRQMFNACQVLESLNLSEFNTSKVQNMYGMFSECRKLKSLDLSSFDTRNVTEMSSMFYICESLDSLDLSTFATSKVENMTSMFARCSKLTYLNVSRLDTIKVSDMGGMFYGCAALTSLDLSSFNTNAVTSFNNYNGGMFQGCSSLKELNLGSNFNTLKTKDTEAYKKNFFKGCTALERIGFNPTNVKEDPSNEWFCSDLLSIDDNTNDVITHDTWYASDLTQIKDALIWQNRDGFDYFTVYNPSDVFVKHKTEILPELQSILQDGDSNAAVETVNQAIELIKNLEYDKSKTLNDNLNIIDIIASVTKEDVFVDRVKNFNLNKEYFVQQMESLRDTQDTDAEKEIIDGAIALLESTVYDGSKTPAANKEALESQLTELQDALYTPRNPKFEDFNDEQIEKLQAMIQPTDSSAVKAIIAQAIDDIKNAVYDKTINLTSNEDLITAIVEKAAKDVEVQRELDKPQPETTNVNGTAQTGDTLAFVFAIIGLIALAGGCSAFATRKR